MADLMRLGLALSETLFSSEGKVTLCSILVPACFMYFVQLLPASCFTLIVLPKYENTSDSCLINLMDGVIYQ